MRWDYRSPRGPWTGWRPGPPPVGVRLPAEVRRVPEPDRAVVEGAAVTGPEGPAVRNVGAGVRGGGAGDRILERPPAPVRLGPPASPPAAAVTGRGRGARRPVTWRMHHLET